MKLSTLVESNASISIPRERVVVVGGTQGIGEGVAGRFAKAGAEIWIVGRNEARATAVLAKLIEISKEQKIEPLPVHYFFKADLSLVSETKRLVQAIRERASSQAVDYLVMSQGGPPNGKFVRTAESYEQHYAVQVLSRFVLAHELSDPSSPTVKKAVMSIMAPGKDWGAVDHNDLEMAKAKERGHYGILAALSRDSAVVDALTVDLAIRNPKVNFTHVFPGAVNTNAMHNSVMPWYLTLMAWVGKILVGRSPQSYAEIPIYLLANPEGRTFAAKEMFSDEKLRRVEPHTSAKDEKLRDQIREHLLEILNTQN